VGIFFGSLLSVVATIVIVAAKGGDKTKDALGWAWIDVVRNSFESAVLKVPADKAFFRW
jgi:hypothetical protein